MNKQHLDTRLLELKQLEASIAKLEEERNAVRKEIFGIVEDEGLTDGYKNEYATVSYVERKSVDIKDELALVSELHDRSLVKYVQEVPPHLELTPAFTKDVKDGKFKHPAVEVKSSTNLAVRFNP